MQPVRHHFQKFRCRCCSGALLFNKLLGPVKNQATRDIQPQFSLWCFIMENFKHTEKLKELYRDHQYPYHLDYAINIFLYMLYHMSVHPSIYLSFHLSIHPYIHPFIHIHPSWCRFQYTPSPKPFLLRSLISCKQQNVSRQQIFVKS